MGWLSHLGAKRNCALHGNFSIEWDLRPRIPWAFFRYHTTVKGWNQLIGSRYIGALLEGTKQESFSSASHTVDHLKCKKLPSPIVTWMPNVNVAVSVFLEVLDLSKLGGSGLRLKLGGVSLPRLSLTVRFTVSCLPALE